MIQNNPNKETNAEIMRIAEEIFGTESDPGQLAVGEATHEKLLAISPDTLLFETDDSGKPIAWIVAIPTTRVLMQEFLAGTITEAELFDQTAPDGPHEALYLCSVITVPEYRRQGHAERLITEAINRLDRNHTLELFVWPTTDEGRKTATALAAKYNRPFHVKSK